MRNFKIALIATFTVVLVSCQNPIEEKEQSSDLSGDWVGRIALNDSTGLNFNAKISAVDSSYVFTVLNGDEQLEATMIPLAKDSFKIEMPVFANYFLVKVEADALLGQYINPDAKDYILPFSAERGFDRYPNTQNLDPLKGYWRMDFNPGSDDGGSGLAYFEIVDGEVHGTVMTSTGDYRYLQGSAAAGKLNFSAFDGAHLFHFEAELFDTIRGRFYSGRSYMAPFLMYKDSTFSLPDPDALTFIKEGYDGFDFSFPNLEGDTVSLSDPRFENKALIVQISGSWCPNCYDESKYLTEVYKQYGDEGLEIVCLSFERARDLETAVKRASKMQKDLQVPYPVLLAGATRDDKAAEKLPMLNHVMSYPTAIYLDRKHQVRKIHTGFSGPGTPVWEDFVSENDTFIQKLIQE